MGSKDKYCPSCGSQKIHKEKESYYAGEVGWEDGLGSPGPLWLERTVYECEDCNETWH